MAGNPHLRAVGQRIAEKGGDLWVFDQLADGVSTRAVAAELGTSRATLRKWRDDLDFPDRAKGWADAMKLAGEAHAEMGLEDLEALGDDPSSGQVQKADKTSKYRQWLAGKRDPAFADKGIELNFNVAELHLQAVADAKALLAGRVIEAEVLAIEEGEPAETGSVEPSAALVAPVEPEAPGALPDALGDLL